jgi:hypothetical protein
VITLWCCFVGSRSGLGPDSSRHLRNCDTNTLGSSIFLGFSIGFSTSFSINELGLTTFNVNLGFIAYPLETKCQGKQKFFIKIKQGLTNMNLFMNAYFFF